MEFSNIFKSMLIYGRWVSFYTNCFMITSIQYYYSTKMEFQGDNTSTCLNQIFPVGNTEKTLISFLPFTFPKLNFPHRFARNLFVRMTRTDIATRYSASQCLEHPFLAGEEQVVPITIHESMMFRSIQ